MSNINKELVKQWVEALRSGKYKQGRKALKNRDNEFCCLGVLCDISREHFVGLDWDIEEEAEPSTSAIYCIAGTIGVLPESILNYVGKETLEDKKVVISSANAKISDLVKKYLKLPHTYLTELNDVYKLSFEQIADIIEEEFLK